jgi:predicted transcriptional regulator
MATDFGALVRASPPVDLVMRLDEVAERMERTRSWMIRQALAKEQRRHELTLEALHGVDEGRIPSHEEVVERGASDKAQRQARR